MKNRFYFAVLLMFCASLFLSSCRHDKKDDKNDDVAADVEYPVAIISDEIVVDLEDDTQLYPVSEDFLRNFMQIYDRYDGMEMNITADFPTEWGVRCIERLPDEKELWLMQSKNREIIYLVVTSGAGTRRILDVLPVAVNISVQNGEILESEEWRTTREPDGAFAVHKFYTWNRSLGEASKADIIANPDNYSREIEVTDRYVINEMGRFEYSEEELEQDYSAVFFFYDKEEKPEDWDAVMELVQSYCEENGIYFDEVYGNYNNVYVRDLENNDIIPLNIEQYVEPYSAGMVMMKSGFEPRTVTFGSEEKLKVEIRRYFKVGLSAVTL